MYSCRKRNIIHLTYIIMKSSAYSKLHRSPLYLWLGVEGGLELLLDIEDFLKLLLKHFLQSGTHLPKLIVPIKCAAIPENELKV